MAVITISRQVAARGDEIATLAAKELGYTFIDRKQIEAKIVELGFPKEKLPKYDERKPGFFASLVKDRDEYLNYLQLAVYEAASQDNVILIGRGSFIILEELPNLLSLRFVAKDGVRMNRLKEEFTWNDKQARTRIDESDSNRKGFHKSFFNLANEDPQHFHMVLNTGLLSDQQAVSIIKNLLENTVDEQKEQQGKIKIQELVKGQRLVNTLLFEHKVNVNFLRALVEGNNITLQGVVDSHGAAENALSLAQKIMGGQYTVTSSISVIQDYKTYQ